MRMQSPVEASSAFSFDKSGSFGYSQPSGHWGCPHQAAAAAGSGSRHACSLRLTPDIAAERAHGSGVPLWPLPTDFSSSGWLEWKFKNGIFKYIEQWYFVTKIDLIYCEKKNVQLIKKNFWNWRLEAKNLQNVWDHNNNLFKQWRFLTSNRLEQFELVLEKNIGILLPKLFWPTVRKNCSSDLKNFANSASNFKNFSRSLHQFFFHSRSEQFW